MSSVGLTDSERVNRIIWVGIAFNIVLAIAKLLSGVFGHSEAVFADGVESVCDLGVGLMALAGARMGNRRMDKCHPYGHGKVESLFAGVTGLIILLTGIAILLQAVHTGSSQVIARPTGIAVLMALITVVTKELLARVTFRVAQRTHSPLVQAQAVDHRKDALTSVATLIGVAGASYGFAMLDPIAAGLSALFILKAGWGCLGEAWDDLMDRSIAQEQLDVISRTAGSIEGVEHVHEIKGRRSGRFVIIDLKLEMDPEMTVRRAHSIADQVKQSIFDACPTVGDVMIHINPHDDGCHHDLTRL